MRCETTSPGVQECALCESSAYHVYHASVCVYVVIGVLVVLCELHVIVRVHVIPLCGAVVGLTLGLIAHVVVVVFVVAILQRILLYLEVYSLQIVEQLLNPIPSSNHVSRKSLEEAEVTHTTSRICCSPEKLHAPVTSVQTWPS